MLVRPLPFCLAASFLLGTLSPAAAQSGAPPDRVGRIAAVSGSVSFHLAGATDWQVASRNLPVTSGTGLWVAAGGEAAIGVAGNRIVLAPSTEFDVDRLDDQALAATQPQGESYWHLTAVAAAETYTLNTPRGTVTIASAGRYGIVSGDTEHPTSITVLDGAATLTGLPTSAEVGAGQTLVVTGDGGAVPFAAAVGPAVQDDFLRHALAAEAPPRPRPPVAPAIIGQMTGSEALEDVGAWSENAEYGPVWYPPAADYVPYRQGRWAYVAPWGWTWVDDAPWGFAPSHYGRWAQFDGRWGWVPGRDWQPGRAPAYAPALVGFLGGAALGVGLAARVGWAPLGPRESYRPPYQANERSLQTLNRPTGANFGAPVMINRTAITIVPTQVLTTSASVAGAMRPGPMPAIGAAPVQFRPQAVPTRATIGATRAVLQQVNPVGLTAPATHIGPGPDLNRPLSEASRPAAGAAAMPQIGPAALLGGAALGAVAGGLLRQPAPQAALPALRDRGAGPPAPRSSGSGDFGGIARPRPPTVPNVLDPAIASGHGPARLPLQNQGGGRPIGEPRPLAGYPVPMPRRDAVEAPVRPAMPRVQYGIPPGQDREAPARFASPPPRQFTPPPVARPQVAAPQVATPAPRQFAAPVQIQRTPPPLQPAMQSAPRPQPNQAPRHEGRPERPER